MCFCWSQAIVSWLLAELKDFRAFGDVLLRTSLSARKNPASHAEREPSIAVLKKIWDFWLGVWKMDPLSRASYSGMVFEWDKFPELPCFARP